MAYVILITAPGGTPVAYGPEPDYDVAKRTKDELVALEEGLTGQVSFLNSMEAAHRVGANGSQ
jgi:hypothetical protein